MTTNSRYYYKEYSNTHQVYLNRKLKTIENCIDEIPIIDECIGFQVWLDAQMAEIMTSKEEKFMEIHIEKPNIAKQIVIGFSLYRRNHQYLFSAYELAYAGLCEPCYNILRTVHESILASWYVTTHPDESEDILEYMSNNKKEGVTKYGYNHFVQSLYTGDTEKSMRLQYSELSAKAHSNILGMKNTEQYSIEQVKDCFWFIKILSFYNIISTIENLAQNSDLRTIVIRDDVKLFIEKLKNASASSDKNIADYFPNKENWSKNFYLYQPELDRNPSTNQKPQEQKTKWRNVRNYPVSDIDEGIRRSLTASLDWLESAYLLLRQGIKKQGLIDYTFAVEEFGKAILLDDNKKDAISKGKNKIENDDITFCQHDKKIKRALEILKDPATKIPLIDESKIPILDLNQSIIDQIPAFTDVKDFPYEGYFLSFDNRMSLMYVDYDEKKPKMEGHGKSTF
ncbi:MAG: hypothetical protein WBF38_05580 [Nitrosotalea sp.]